MIESFFNEDENKCTISLSHVLDKGSNVEKSGKKMDRADGWSEGGREVGGEKGLDRLCTSF